MEYMKFELLNGMTKENVSMLTFAILVRHSNLSDQFICSAFTIPFHLFLVRLFICSSCPSKWVFSFNIKNDTFERTSLFFIMNRITFFLVITLLVDNACAQTLVPYLKKNGKYIYVDSVTMKPVITREFGQAWLFKNGIACVNDDTRSKDIFAFDNIPDYYIDQQGKPLKAGRHLINYPFDEDGYATVKIDGHEGLYDKQGKEIIAPAYDQVYGFYTHPVCLVKQNDKYGLVNRQGQLVVAPKYENHGFFSDGLIFMQNNEKWGAIDAQGKIIIPFIYEDAGRFQNGVGDVVLNGKAMLIDKKNKPVPLAHAYDDVQSFGNGYASVKRGNAWGYIDRKGAEVVPAVYDSVGFLFTGDRAPVALNGKWGLVDEKGKLLVACVYDRIHSFNDNLYTTVIKNDKMGFLSKSGKLTVPAIYDDASVASEEIGFVKKGNKWGVVELATGKLLLPVEHQVDDASDMLFPQGYGRMYKLNGVFRTAEGKIYKEQ
jgi:hypothetical protein